MKNVSKTLFVALVVILISHSHDGFSAGADPDADYDRLDGHGSSGKKVQVIEWENNLEVHVYPKGSLVGLALKLDKKNKDKPVMVIGYRFDIEPKKQYIRRAILGIPMQEGFKTYRDPSADDYDKIIISNNGLSDQVVAFKLDPPPTQLYPKGDKRNNPVVATDKKQKPQTEQRTPAGDDSDSTVDNSGPDDNGTIQPFFMRGKTNP